MKLVIIEGAGKKETIEKYLGKGYRVFATKGHVRDLPEKTLAVDVKNNFEPRYEVITDKKDIVKKMQAEAANADEILLATDPDREGEAISWHVAKLLKIPEDKKARIVFNEISKKAVSAAIENPRAINIDLVNAQQARRVLDRLVGYKVSPILCKRIQNKLSAGRVQSVSLRLVVERDREIENFKPEEYWNFWSILNKDGINFRAALATKNSKKIKLKSAEEVESVKKAIDSQRYIVTAVKRTVVQGKPPAPFITSSMQQDALNKLGMSLSQTSLAAQNLYEGVELPGEGKIALITYIRTDSTRISDDAQAEAREFIADKYGKNYVPDKPNVYASKKNTQDAHEAIRPITLQRSPESLKKVLSGNLYRLYKLVYERFLASQMSPAKYDSLSVDIAAGEYGFKVTGKTLIFPGYTAVYKTFEDEKDKGEDEEGGSVAGLPNLTEGDNLAFVEYKYEQKFTKPPAHYTEASLVKTMEEKGIGRPATYSPTVSLLVSRKYLNKEGKFLISSQLGREVTDMLIKYFPDIMDVKFTAGMEEKLDNIEDEGTAWQAVVEKFYTGLEAELKAAMGDKPPDEESDFECSQCGSKMVYRSGRFGKFLACTGFPKCRFTQQIDENGSPIEVKQEVSDVVCENCGKTMVYKNGRYGRFLACPGYPKCKNIKNIEGEPNSFAKKTAGKSAGEPGGEGVSTGASVGGGTAGNVANSSANNAADGVENALPPCPTCGRPLVKRSGRSVFYGCSGYPECRFISSYRPIAENCPDCKAYLVIRKFKDGFYHVCSKGCGHKDKQPEVEEQIEG